jgi:hypothetical protein
MNIIAWLRTPLATLIVLCSALIAQLPHAADVFRMIVMGDGALAVAHSYTYAVALELAVLLFVVQRRNVESYIFAGVSILVNLSYYYLHGVALLTIAALPAWLISIALPAAIAQYSHLIAAATGEHEAPATTPATTTRRWWRFWQKPLEADVTSNLTAAPEQTRYGVPVGTLTPQNVMDAASQPPAESPNQAEPAPALRKVGKTNEYGMTDTQLAEMLGVKRQAIAPMRDRGTLTARIARDLPQLEPVYTNGVAHE